jgi:hypothetical protein
MLLVGTQQVDLGEFARTLHPQRLEQHRLDHRKYRRVGARERQGQNGRHGKCRLTEFVKLPALIAKPKPPLLATDHEKISTEFVKISYGFAIVLEIILPGLRSVALRALIAGLRRAC